MDAEIPRGCRRNIRGAGRSDGDRRMALLLDRPPTKVRTSPKPLKRTSRGIWWYICGRINQVCICIWLFFYSLCTSSFFESWIALKIIPVSGVTGRLRFRRPNTPPRMRGHPGFYYHSPHIAFGERPVGNYGPHLRVIVHCVPSPCGIERTFSGGS